MNIASLCRREVVAIPASASLPQVANRMADEHVGALVVATTDDPPRVMGILTDRDLALDVIARGESGSNLSAGDIAKKSLVAVSGNASLQEATAAMEKGGVRRLLVLDDAGGVIGLVSAEDLLAAISEELAHLAQALRSGIEREKGERKPAAKPAGPRPVFPSFGTAIQGAPGSPAFTSTGAAAGDVSSAGRNASRG